MNGRNKGPGLKIGKDHKLAKHIEKKSNNYSVLQKQTKQNTLSALKIYQAKGFFSPVNKGYPGRASYNAQT